MEDSAAILFQISSCKDMLDQVNEEIEANFHITREIESEIVKFTEVEIALADRESELMKTSYMLRFEISGLETVTANSRASMKFLMEEMCNLKLKQGEILKRMNERREAFIQLCVGFQKDIDKNGNVELVTLLTDKEFLENEIDLLSKRNNALQNSIMEFSEEMFEDLQGSISDLQIEIQRESFENEKLLSVIDELKVTLLSIIST